MQILTEHNHRWLETSGEPQELAQLRSADRHDISIIGHDMPTYHLLKFHFLGDLQWSRDKLAVKLHDAMLFHLPIYFIFLSEQLNRHGKKFERLEVHEADGQSINVWIDDI